MTAKPKTRREGLEYILKRDFCSFLHRVFQTVSPHDAFVMGWHLSAIAWQLHRLEEGDSNRLIINVPPRSLKSIAVSVAWVAWLLGHDPSRRIICVSYSGELAAKLHRDCRKVMESAWYKAIFPLTRIERATDVEIQTTRNGGRFATSLGGTLTGRGADYIIVDDPQKPDEAQSEAGRRSAKEWFGGTLVSRLNNKTTGVMVVVMQRLHEDDLSGHLLETGAWEHLNLPAIAEVDEDIVVGPPYALHHRRAGDLLQPEREPLAVLELTKASMGSAAFAAQYQQAPVPAGGVMVQPHWLRRYDELPLRRGTDRVVQSWDCATKTGIMNDFSVCLTAVVTLSGIYVLDVYRAKLTFPELLRAAISQADLHRPSVLLIEDAASGAQLIQQLVHDRPRGVPMPIGRRPELDKISRLAGCTGRIEAGELLLPEDATWLPDFLRELLGFPSARHDDQVDALSQLMDWVRETPALPRVMPYMLEKELDDIFVGRP